MSNFKQILNKLTKPIVLKTFLAITIAAALVFVGFSFLKEGAAAKVNSAAISLKDYNRNVEAEFKYQKEYQKKTSFTGEEDKQFKKKVLDRLIEEEVVLEEAKKFGIAISQKDIDDEYQSTVQANGGETKMNEVISKYYGFTKEEYKNYITKPKLLREKVEEKVLSSDEINKTAKTKANDVLKQLKDGADFSELAKKYSEDVVSGTNGGDLGWVNKGKMVKEFEDQAFALKAGETSEVFKTVYGCHIIKVTEKKGEQVKISQILFKTQSFTDWLSSKVKSADVKIFVKI